MNYSKHVEVRHKRSKEGIIEYKAASRTLFLYVKVTQLCLTFCDPLDCNPPGSAVHGDSSGKNTGVICHALLQGITLQVDSLPSEPPGKTKNIGVGNLSFLQGNFPTQELNQGLLYCRWTLYQLSYLGED